MIISMRTNEITKIYIEGKPLTDIEFKKILDHQYICPEILNDLLRIVKFDLQDANAKTYIVLLNAIQLGIIMGKRSERIRRKLDLFTPMSSVDMEKERISKSIKIWGNMDEWDLIEVIKELKSITKEDKLYQVKENLLTTARAIYSKKFINKYSDAAINQDK